MGGIYMRKYHLADVLTSLETLCAAILIGFAIGNVPVDYALWVFAAAELCDAFDGICARRWPYPDDGKRRWWRIYAVELDQLSDIAAGLACLLYVSWRVSFTCGLVVLITALVIGFSIQLTVKWPSARRSLTDWGLGSLARWYESVRPIHRLLAWLERHPKLCLALVLIRRYLYVAAIAVLIICMILGTSWPQPLQFGALGALVAIGIFLIFYKRDRLTQDKTPLPKAK